MHFLDGNQWDETVRDANVRAIMWWAARTHSRRSPKILYMLITSLAVIERRVNGE